MKNHKLYKAITEIKDDYILESKPQKNTFYQMPGFSKRTQVLKRAVAVAAVFAVLLLGIGMANPTWAQKVPLLGKIVQYFRNDIPENPPVSDTPTEDTESVVTPAPDSEKTSQSTSENKSQKTDSTENENTETGTNTQIVISSIKIDFVSKTIIVDLLIPESESANSTNYWIEHTTTMKSRTLETEDGLSIRQYGFYTDDAAWKNPKLYRGFQSPTNTSQPLENVKTEGEVTQIDEKDFEANIEGSDISLPVQLTPYGVTIRPDADWREGGHFYYVIATDTDGRQYYMCNLPSVDDRKPSEKKAHPLPAPYADMDTLGDNLSAACELDHCGIQYIFNETIDLNTIQEIEVKSLYP